MLHSGILSCSKCYVGAGGMHKLSRFEANSAVKKGAVLNSGVRVSKIAPIALHSSSPTPPKTTLSKIPTNAAEPREESSVIAKWELYGTGGIAALHDTAESTAALAVHHSLGLFDAVIVTGTVPPITPRTPFQPLQTFFKEIMYALTERHTSIKCRI
jgi:hypothetical protein